MDDASLPYSSKKALSEHPLARAASSSLAARVFFYENSLCVSKIPWDTMDLESNIPRSAPNHSADCWDAYNILKNIENFKLGETADQVPLEGSEDNRIAALALARQAERSLRIFTRDLEATVYNTLDFVEAVTKLATLSQYSMIHILIQDSTNVVKNGHRLVDLAYRLSSKIKLRKPCDEYRNYNEAFLIVDETGLMHKKLADRYEGMVNFNDSLEARNLAKFFDEVWEKSDPDPELRRLHL